MANFIGVLIARDVALGFDVRNSGVRAGNLRITAYASAGVHNCVARAMDFAGIGREALRLIPSPAGGGMDIAALERTIAADRAAGFAPFLIVGTAGSVDTGSIDDLNTLADISRREQLWFHVDGAYGALGILAPGIAPRLNGIQRADSLAFDFHKWGQVPYDAGFVLVRDRVLHRNTFASYAAYLQRMEKGLAGGEFWPCDFGPDLSRGFRALKTWFTFKVYGADAIGATISRTCELARYLESRVQEAPELELLAPVPLNIVCFRFSAGEDSDRVNARIVTDLQESGSVAPSTTIVDNKLAIRAAIVNHRTGQAEIDKLIEAVLTAGRAIRNVGGQTKPQPTEDFRRLREERLQQLEGCASIPLQFERACLLTELGKTQEARDAYIGLLSREPSHCAALNNLGTLLHESGFRTAARTAYSEAVARHPNDAMSRVNLGNVLREGGDIDSARLHYEAALRSEPNHAEAHQGLASVLEELGDAAGAARHRRIGFGSNPVVTLPYRGDGTPVSVLVLVAAEGGNIPLRHLLDNRVFQATFLFPEYFDPMFELPAHQIVFNAIGDADLAGSALAAARSVLAKTSMPVLNNPAAVTVTGRDAVSERLSGIPGVLTSKAVTLPRTLLNDDSGATLARHGFEFPFLIRTPGFHTGRHFLRIENSEQLPAALAELPGDHLTILRYLNAYGSDGNARKYRVMMIDGRLYPLHLAVSREWKIHYFTADMADHPEHRAEDERFLNDMPSVLGKHAMMALSAIQKQLGLDYAGIDFGLNSDGEILLFEANATMVVNPPEPGEKWAYRQPAVERIHAAVRKMLLEKIRASYIWIQ
jgi:glutamate/tyrosine decarboxylase-like PLP-dependent enzyme